MLRIETSCLQTGYDVKRSIFGTKLRWSICGLLFFATTVNYVDRQVLGILKPVLEKELGWNERITAGWCSRFSSPMR